MIKNLSPVARGLRGQRHLVYKHRWKVSLRGLRKQLAWPWLGVCMFCRLIYSCFEYLGCRDHEKIARRSILTIIIQTLTSVQDTYDLLLFGDMLSLENQRCRYQVAIQLMLLFYAFMLCKGTLGDLKGAIK